MAYLKLMLVSILMLMICSVALAADPATPVVEKVNYIMVTLGCLFAVSEVLASIPALESNSIFQLIKKILKALVGMK